MRGLYERSFIVVNPQLLAGLQNLSSLKGSCYPDRLISVLPNLYYYAATRPSLEDGTLLLRKILQPLSAHRKANNPSEATIAKRRSYAPVSQACVSPRRSRIVDRPPPSSLLVQASGSRVANVGTNNSGPRYPTSRHPLRMPASTRRELPRADFVRRFCQFSNF